MFKLPDTAMNVGVFWDLVLGNYFKVAVVVLIVKFGVHGLDDIVMVFIPDGLVVVQSVP